MSFFSWLSSLFKPKPAPARPVPQRPNVYLLTGFGGNTWSGGLHATAQLIRDIGLTAEVRPYTDWQKIVAEVRSAPAQKLLAFVGHSFGGGAAIKIARELDRDGLAVFGLFLLDPSEPAADVPEVTDNVAMCVESYCIPTTVLLKPGPRVVRARGNALTAMLANAVTVPIIHTNIADNDDLRRRIIHLLRGA